jgi:predicted ATPase/CheY-like chemotaxis protein
MFNQLNHLYGRENDINALLASFERIGRGSGEVLLIPGYSGIGKTALVQEIRKPVQERNGFFLQGKFNQYQQNIPYFAIRQALAELAKELQFENEALRLQWKTTLQQAVGSLGKLLVDLVPEFESLLGEQPPVAEISPLESRHRFATVLRNFFAAICQPENPVVLFIDDWQWADTASFELLKQFQIGSALRYLLVIAPYRDNEVDNAHPLIATINELHRQNVPVDVIEIKNLAVADVLTWTNDLLPPEVKNAGEFAQFIHTWTAGNPFFTQAAFRFLYENQLLCFDEKTQQWHWEQAAANIEKLPKDVVELFSRRLLKLDETSRELLTRAACLGNHFDLNSLAAISNWELSECRSLLLDMKEMVIPLKNDRQNVEEFMFVHDRVQQAAYSLIPLEKLPFERLNIGRELLSRLNAQQLAENLFEVVDHLNIGQSLITTIEEQFQAVKLNIAAADKARRATAYQAMLQFHRAVARFLENATFTQYLWSQHHDLAMAFFQAWAESEFLEGNHAKSEECIQQAVIHAQTPTEKAGAINILIVQNTLLARYPEAIVAGRQALKALGIELPEDNYDSACLAEIALFRQTLGNRTVESLVDLPVMSHLEMRMAVKILITMGPPCYRSHQKLWSVMVPKVVNLTLQYGNIEQVGYSHPAFAGLLCWIADDFEMAKAFGDLSTQLMTKVFQSPTDRSVYFLMHGSSVQHWFEPLNKGSQDYAEACEIGLQSGNLQYTAYALGHNMYCRFYQGIELDDLIKESERSLAFSRTRFNQWAIDLLEGGLKIFSFLANEKNNDAEDFPQEAQYLNAVELHHNIQVTCIYKSMKSLALLCLGRYEEALSLSEQVMPILYTVGTQGLLPWAEHLFTRALILTALVEQVDENQQAIYRTELVSLAAKLQLWSASCSTNFAFKAQLIAAEIARLDENYITTIELYEQAIDSAKAGGFVQWEGFAYERAARFWQARQNDKLAHVYWQQAYSCFERWGAKAKLQMMEQEYRHWLSAEFSKIPDFSSEALLEKQIHRIRSQAMQSAKAHMQDELELQSSELAHATEHLRIEVAERKRIETELLHARDAANSANKTKSVFLANMSHELRTPLNAILGFSRLMRADLNVTVDQAEDLDIIVRSGEHLLGLINNVLDISKIEAGRVELEESSCDLHHLLNEIQSLLNVRAVEKDLIFSLALADDLPRYVFVDAGKLRQVLTNLVGNAIKFTRHGGVTLHAKYTGRETKQGIWLYFAVEDTGSGISEENCKRIFTPFVQVGQQAPVEAGTGLGLTISRQFVELMHGVLEVGSVINQGSTFHFEIPVILSTPPENVLNVEQTHGKVIGLEAGQPRYRLLIAEDQPENKLLIHKILEPLGFELFDAMNGEEALTQYAQWQPDLIWMDMRMPVMDGLEATRRIRASENGQNVRIVALTAHALEDERLEILKAGCDDVVRKPYRENELFDALSKYLGVRFVYQAQTPVTVMPEHKKEIDPAQLQQLPLHLLEKLQTAFMLLDEDLCLEIAGIISDKNHVLGGQIRTMTEKFQHDKLLKLIEPLLKSSAS